MAFRAADEMHAGFVEQMEARQVKLNQLMHHHMQKVFAVQLKHCMYHTT